MLCFFNIFINIEEDEIYISNRHTTYVVSPCRVDIIDGQWLFYNLWRWIDTFSIKKPCHVTRKENDESSVYDSITLTKKLDKDIRSGKMTTFCNLAKYLLFCVTLE